ncbi:unnamed protein product [Prunus armeniaca]
MSVGVPKWSIEEYLMFFRHCTKRRTYPSFQPGYRQFEKEPEEEAARTDFRKKFLSVTLPRDLPFGGGKPTDSWCRPLRTLMLKSLKNIGGQALHAGKVIVESPSPPPTRSNRLRKRTVMEYVATEPTTTPTTTSGTDEELREALEDVEQEKEVMEGPQEKTREVDEEEIPAKVITQKVELTSSELALFDDVDAEHSTTVPEPEAEQVKEIRTAGTMVMMTSPLKPPIVAMPIHSLSGSSTTASFADP